MDKQKIPKHAIFLMLAFAFHLSGCSSALAVMLTATPKQQVIPQPTATATPVQVSTSTAIPTNTASLIPTPSLQVVDCSIKKPDMSARFDYSLGESETYEHFFAKIVDFLNAGGSHQAVIAAYTKEHPRAGQRDIQEKDVTADGIPDLLLTEDNNLVAFICLNRQYQVKQALRYETYHDSQPSITKIIDMNQNGVPEIISSNGDLRFRVVYVSEWDGNEFPVLNDVELPEYYETRFCSVLMGTSKVSIRDTDNNGTLELILEQGIPIWSEYTMGLPWRRETRICKWDGKAFLPDNIAITDPPHYRFQALQDADRASLLGDYARALDLYQQTIFNDKLDWWSQDRRIYEVRLYNDKLPDEVYSPTPLPSMSPDPAEYPMLAAYARFRIMLLHTLSRNLPEAKIAYDTLQAKFPTGQTGHVQAEMANAFWNEYQVSKNIKMACAKAIEYATSHPADVLSYLGNSQYNTDMSYGSQSLEYKPKDVCPFN